MTGDSSQSNATLFKGIAAGAVLLLVAAGSFLGGVHYQKGRSQPLTAANAGNVQQFGQGQGQGRFRTRLNGALGAVTAVSPASISVNDNRSGTTKTYSITGGTQVSNNGQTASINDIAVGDTVLVSASANSAEAARIIINPGFGGNMMMGNNAPAATPQTQTN